MFALNSIKTMVFLLTGTYKLKQIKGIFIVHT